MRLTDDVKMSRVLHSYRNIDWYSRHATIAKRLYHFIFSLPNNCYHCCLLPPALHFTCEESTYHSIQFVQSSVIFCWCLCFSTPRHSIVTIALLSNKLLNYTSSDSLDLFFFIFAFLVNVKRYAKWIQFNESCNKFILFSSKWQKILWLLVILLILFACII